MVQLVRRDPVGRVDGVSPASGEVGEVQNFAYTGSTVTVSGTGVSDVHSFSLPAGIWLITCNYYLSLIFSAGASAGNSLTGAIELTDNSNNVLISGANSTEEPVSAQLFNFASHVALVYAVVISAQTTYKIRLRTSVANGSGSVFPDNTTLTSSIKNASVTRAVRIG